MAGKIETLERGRNGRDLNDWRIPAEVIIGDHQDWSLAILDAARILSEITYIDMSACGVGWLLI